MAGTIKTNLELDSSKFEASVNSARGSVDALGTSVDSIAQSINEAAAKEKIAETSFKNLKKEFNAQKAVIQDLTVKMKALGESAQNTQAYKELKQQLDEAREKALGMKDAMQAAAESVQDLKVGAQGGADFSSMFKNMDASGLDFGGVFSQFSGLGQKLDQLSKGFDTLGNAMKGTQGGAGLFQRAMAQAKPPLDALGASASKLPGILGRVGSSFASLSTVGKLGWIGAVVASITVLSKVMGDAVQASTEFGSAMSQLGAITGTSGSQLDSMRAQIQNVAKDTYTASKDVADNFALIGSALPMLLKDAEGLEQVSRSAITLSKAGLMPLKDATDSLTVSMAQFNLGAESSGYATDVLANAAQKGSAGISSIAETLKNCGTAANQAGLNLHEAAAAAEVLADKGLKGAEAGTQLKTMFTKMQTSGLDELNPKIVGMEAALKNLSKHANNAAFMNATFGESASQAATILAQNTGRYEELVAAMGDYDTAAEMARVNSDNLAGDINKLTTAWTNFLSSFNMEKGWGDQIFRGLVEGCTYLIEALQELVHAFDPLFEINTTDMFDVNPVADFCNVIKQVIVFVSQIVKAFLELTHIGTLVGDIFNVVGGVIQFVGDCLEIINALVAKAIQWWNELITGLTKAAQDIPILSQAINALKTLRGWIADIITAWKKLKESICGDTTEIQIHYETHSLDELKKDVKELEHKRELKIDAKADTKEIDALIGKVNELIAKKQEAANTDVWNKDYAKGSLADLEAQLSELQDQMKKGTLVIDITDAKKKIAELQGQISAKKKELGFDSGSSSKRRGGGGSSQPKPRKGSLTYLENQRSNIEKGLKDGTLKISTTEAQHKIEELQDKIRNKKIELGIIVPGSLSDLENRLSELQTKYKNGVLKISPDDYDKQVRDFEKQIADKRIELKIDADPKSVVGLENQISKLRSDMEHNRLKIPVDEALKTISQLENELRDKQIEIGVAPKEGTGDYLQAELDKFVKDYRLGLHPEISPDEFKKKVADTEKEIKSTNIKMGIDLDLDKAEKSFNDLLSDFKKKSVGSSFEQATGGKKQFGGEGMTVDDNLEAIREQMDANDELIAQLQDQLQIFAEMGDAGAEAYQRVADKIQEVTDKQSDLSVQAKDLDKQAKSTKKLQKNWKGAGDSLSAFGDAMGALGDATESPELNIAGTIAQGIANIVIGATEASAQAATMGPWAWIAFAAAAMAQMATMIAQVHQLSGYASGGIIHSGSRVGDKNLVRVNGGEMIMNNQQQQRLWNLISGSQSWNYASTQNGANSFVLESRISGRDLVLALKNNERQLNKVGKSIGIKY